ncbi:hypothetical protein R6258_07695 [Halomonas sp. HP20-15]|uniref:hypothetical protein n=1 Tax=Halomonas sp. HP20-15 TaxID=3085901 RepID=UPI0029826C89|nr:hypothetical protein [Halomonas sp. HP20-15]MDW5376802.1 hypothetical protein [Halomonas sp. HP20-15]
MQCNCRQDLEARLAERMKKDLPEGFHDYNASLQGYALILSDPVEERVAVTYEGDVQVPKKGGNGTKRQKIKANITANYCPFCGKSAEVDKEQ